MMRRHKPENPKAPLPIVPLAILLYLDRKWSFRIFGKGRSPTNECQKPWQNNSYCW